MLTGRLRIFLLLSVTTVMGAVALAQSPASHSSGTLSSGKHEERLKMVVILSRHGVRSPTWTLDRLNTYSALPWPAWSVEPGILTDRGFELLQRFGAYDRAALAAQGLLAAKGCADAPATFVWADTDQRTVASGHALAESLLPGCGLAVHSLADGQNDPVFHAAVNPLPVSVASAAASQITQRLAEVATPSTEGLLQQMQRILLACKPDADCVRQHEPEVAFLSEKTALASGKGDKAVALKGPLPLGSTFSEDFLLEYAEGMPMGSVGWGNVDEAELRRLLELHTVYFDLLHRTPALAKAEQSNLLLTIARTLAQGMKGQPVEGAKGVPGDKLVVLVGHDTNIGGLAALLGLHWNLDGRRDDTPPGTELVFELSQDPAGGYSVRVRVAMQTLSQLRGDAALTISSPPAREVVTPSGCSEKESSCSWQQFAARVAASTGETIP